MTDPKLLPLPEAEYSFSPYGGPCLHDSETLADYARACVAHATAAKDAEIEALRVRADAMAGEAIKHESRAERLRADKSDLKAALEYLKAHKENAAMNQDGIIKALSEVRDEQGAEIHRLRAELKIAKGQAEFYRTTRNWNQRKVERLAEALHKLEDSCEDSDGAQYGTLATSFVRGICRDALRDHDQEVGND